MRMMGTSSILATLLLSILLVSGLGCSPRPEATPTPTPTQCEADKAAVQTAISTFYMGCWQWPTADGEPGDIEWTKLVPDLLASIPITDSKCDWSVNSDPEGTACAGDEVGCMCSCRCATRCSQYK